ncbi:dehydrodolichyl diphosphate synthase complex subunit Nus1 isoform X1 [Microplitis demolitor]|uniref:dehydrodolichyl diphosphate synthase complex subunit Nus1 isoform X1 n=2 Tax=Microplitis demolitor TaxID=69319 RepID=UPI0004CD8421|nr:dehydrodolichyl diphosphate synthase complex subunit Nus1 isoform X1 [Microplitis demolitor]
MKFSWALKLIHLIVTLYVYLSDFMIILKRELINYIRPKTLKCIDTIVDICDVSKLIKLPKHLVIVVACEDISFGDLARIIGWCCALGIPNISFYDRQGIINKKSCILKKEFYKLTPSFVSRVIWSDKINEKSINGLSNGDLKQLTRVNLVTYEDGKPEIIKLTQELSKAVKQKLLKTEDINYDLIEEKLSLPSPDPDLAIVTGRTFSTFGLLPWHIRLTEFYNVPTHHNLSPHEFIKILEAFAKCQQRLGT